LRLAKKGPPLTKKQILLKKKGRIMNLKLFQRNQERLESQERISRNVALLTGYGATLRNESLESTIGGAGSCGAVDEN
jgi:hypothetical protein